MKNILFLFFAIFGMTVARADLHVEIGLIGLNPTNVLMGVVDRIKGNKCRQDIFFEGQNAESQIINMNTGEGFQLVPDKKTAVKTSVDQSMRTNQIAIDAIKDTGEKEIVDGYDAEIYTYSSSTGGDFTLWIAKGFPNFEIIKSELIKRDRLNMATRSGLFHLSTLPGMLLKCHAAITPTNAPPFRVLINEEPIDESIFEVPKDYTWQEPPVPIATSTNNVSHIK
jgi:hypothetical protein